MTDLAEKVARALCQEYGDTPDCWRDHLPEAKVAINIVLEDAASSLWEDLPEAQRKNIRLNNKAEHQFRCKFSAAIRAMKGKNDG